MAIPLTGVACVYEKEEGGEQAHQIRARQRILVSARKGNSTLPWRPGALFFSFPGSACHGD